MPNNLQDIINRKNRLIADATEFVTRSGLKTSEDKAQHQRLLAEIDAVTSDIANLQQIERQLNGNKATQSAAPVPSAVITRETNQTPEQRATENRNRAYLDYFGRGFVPGRAEQRDLTTSSDGSGEALVQQDWRPQWISALKQFGPLASLCRVVVKTDGTRTKLPYADPTGQVMHYLADAGSVNALEADPSVNSIVPSTDTLVSFTKASIQLYKDAEIEGGLEGFIRENIFGIAARAFETAILSGVDGVGAALPNNAGFLSSVPQGAVTTSASAVTYASLLSLYGSIDAAYRNAPGAAFYASQVTHDAIAGILDSANRPIFQFDQDGLLRVFGKPVYVAGTSSGMPSVGTVSKPIVLFGDFKSALAAVQRPLQTRVLVERFMADSLEIGFVSHQRVGSQVGISGAVKALVTAAS